MHEGETAEFRSQGSGAQQYLLKDFGSYAQSASRHLHDRPKRSLPKTHGQRHSYHAFLADYAHLDASTVAAKSHQGAHTFIQKIDEINFLPRLMQNKVLRQLYRFEMRSKEVVLSIRQRKQDDITNCLSSRVGTGAGTQPDWLHRPCRPLNACNFSRQSIHLRFDAITHFGSRPRTCSLFLNCTDDRRNVKVQSMENLLIALAEMAGIHLENDLQIRRCRPRD